MKIAAYHSHLNGWEWMQVHHADLWDEISGIIARLDAEALRTKVSQEKRMVGRMLYSPEAINERLKELFRESDWQESVTNFYVTDDMQLIRATVDLSTDEQKREIAAAGKTPIFSFNQTDFVKERVAVEVQFGKYAFIAYDLFVKHMAFFVGDKIDLGVEVLPTKAMQRQMSSGVGYYEHALYSIGRQGRGIPAVPLVLIGIEADETPTLAEIEAQEGVVADEVTE
jgi:hypothetical protein